MATRRRQSAFCMVTEPLDSMSPPPSSRSRHSRRRNNDNDDESTFSHRSMLTDTSTFSSSDGKRGYKKTTVTTTTTIESTEPRSPLSASTSRSSSNWSCGWDAPLISEPTLSSLPTYTFDSDRRDKKKKHGKKDKKDNKSAKKADDGQTDRKSGGHKAQGRRRPKRRPTDAETDAEIYRTDRAADPWLSRRPPVATTEGATRPVSSKETVDDPWSRDVASEADATGSVYHSSDDHAAVANTSSWPLAPHKNESSDRPPSYSSSSSESQEDVGSASADSSALSASVDHNHAIDATESAEYGDRHAHDDDNRTDGTDQDAESYPSASSSLESSATASTYVASDLTSSTNAHDCHGYDGVGSDDDGHVDGHGQDDTGTASYGDEGDDHSNAIGNDDRACRCWCVHDLGHDESDTTTPATLATSIDRDGDSAIDASWDASAPVACTCHCAAAHDESSTADSSVASLSFSSSTAAVDECAKVKIDRRVRKPREPPVYIRACHRGTTHRRGSLCDTEDDDERPAADESARKDGVIETASVTIAEPVVRPCEPDAPHAIYGRPRRAHCDAKPSAPVVVAPGVCDLPGGVTESFCALGATYTLLAGAVDTQCRVEAALVTLQPRACAQPAFVFAGSDVSFVGVSGTGAITINGRTYPLTPTAYFYVRAGSAFAVGNSAGSAPLVFVQQFVGAAAGLGFYHEVATYEAAVGGAVNVDPRVVEAIGEHYHVRAASASGPCGALGNRWNTFVPPGVVRFVPTPLCEDDKDDESADSDGDEDSTSSLSSSCLASSTDAYGARGSDQFEDDQQVDDAKDAGLDSWGLQRRQLLVLAAVGPCQGPAARPAATVRPTDLDAFVAVGALGTRVAVRATIIRDPRFGGCPDVLAHPTINGQESITLATGVSYWTYYDEAEDNVIVQSLPGSRLPPTVPPPLFGAPQLSLPPFVPGAIVPGALPASGLPPIAVRPLPFA
ncbi:Cupin-like domain-containing protein [Pandoravirus kuranda]|uniref:Cupin-like domain-containing protein n=1 Tax=Pandoravirus kuranda TaxID=3019033 RepID=A0AA95EBZ2_9VIRU|nr:Cupin-like domain-containing protein [Pandoravirus kuranda]